jgi:hypothetical protein
MALSVTAATSDVIDHGTLGSWDPSAFTWAIWVKFDSIDPVRGVLCKTIDGGSPVECSLLTVNTNKLQFQWRGTGSWTVARSADDDITTGTWYFVAVTADITLGSDFAIMYLGTLTSTVADVTDTRADDATSESIAGGVCRAGNRIPGDNESNGASIAMYGMWPGVLTPGQLKILQWSPRLWSANDPQVLSYPGMVGSASSITDLSGNGFVGTGTGLAIADHVPLGPPFGFDLGWQGAFTTPAAASNVFPSRRHPSKNISLRL